MRKKMLAGNWKMHKTRAEVKSFLQAFCAGLGSSQCLKQVDVLFAVPFTLLDHAKAAAEPLNIRIAAQNMHYEKQGAFTGEVSPLMLRDLGIDCTLIGHSERRQFFAETDATVAKKVAASIEYGIQAIVCVGETKDQRTSGQTFSVVGKQVQAVLDAIGKKPMESLIIAYEPVWAIGTGLTATATQAQEVHAFIRDMLAKHFGTSVSEQIRILYGGSVNAGNVVELISQADIDGGLVGGASLKADEFAKMVVSASSS